MSDLVKRLRIKAGMIEMGELIAWGSDSALMREAADALEMAAPAVQGEPVSAQIRYRRPEKGQPDWSVWQPAAVMLDRPSWDIDSQGWEVEYRLLYTTPQPAEQQREPCHECGGNGAGGEHEEDCSQQPAPDVTWNLMEALVQQYETNRHLTIGRWIEHGPFAKLFATYPKQRGEA